MQGVGSWWLGIPALPVHPPPGFLSNRSSSDRRSLPQQGEVQHKYVVQVLWLVVQVLVQSMELQRAVAPPATASRESSPQRVSLESVSFFVVFFIDPPV
jgi:hypothetical protein